jgi:Outer membrane efflux protein
MRKLYATSALFALAVGAAWAQPPAKSDPPPVFKGDPPKKVDPPKKPADPTDAAIASALANDAGVKMARAKVQLAEAELAQAKQAVTLRVVTLRATIASYRSEFDVAKKRLELTEAAHKNGVETPTALIEARIYYEKANRALATAEAELRLLTGDGTDSPFKVLRAFELPDLAATERDHETRLRFLAQLMAQARATQPPVGPVPDRIRAALDKTVKLSMPQSEGRASKVLSNLLLASGLNVVVRWHDSAHSEKPVTVAVDELPLVALVQLIEDQTGTTAYVREYGILFAEKKNAPPDAVPLVDFWKQKPAAAVPAPAPAPKK